MNSNLDPIAAIATAPGRGGIGVVRISGRNLRDIVEGVLGPESAARLQPRRALHARFLDAQGEAIDSGLALLFPAPHSYTGETVLELQGHGGPVVLRLLLARCLEAGRSIGVRIAEPGEFTRRAFLHDRLDLAQAEAVADLIDAGTAAAARGALRSLEGGLSRAARDLGAELTELRALAEATLDFPEEEIDVLRAADAAARLERTREALDGLRQRARQGALLRDGVRVVLAGAPNVGKSSLLNALAGQDVAIVTEHAGTTRDRIECRIEIEGVAFNLVDTAGLRETADPVEGIGVERAREALAQADVVLEMLDDRAPQVRPLGAGLESRLVAGTRRLTVHNKVDLSGAAPGARDGRVYLSALSGAGVDSLRVELLRVAGWSMAEGSETVFLARERHLQALDRAAELLQAACAHELARLELFAEDLRLAGEALASITGEVSSDELLGRIFSRFCIGK
jgi:tRNA modification GTPase